MKIIFITYVLLFQVVDQVITWSAHSRKSEANHAQK